MNTIVKPLAATLLGVYSWSGLFGVTYQFSGNPSHQLAALIILCIAIVLSILLALAVLSLR